MNMKVLLTSMGNTDDKSGDFKVTGMLLGLAGYIKTACFLCEWNSWAKQTLELFCQSGESFA